MARLYELEIGDKFRLPDQPELGTMTLKSLKPGQAVVGSFCGCPGEEWDMSPNIDVEEIA